MVFHSVLNSAKNSHFQSCLFDKSFEKRFTSLISGFLLIKVKLLKFARIEKVREYEI